MRKRKSDQTFEHSQAQEYPQVLSLVRNALNRLSSWKFSKPNRSSKEATRY